MSAKHHADGSQGFILQLAADLMARRAPVGLADLMARHGCSRATIHRAVAKIERYFPDRVEYVRGVWTEPGKVVPRRQA